MAKRQLKKQQENNTSLFEPIREEVTALVNDVINEKLDTIPYETKKGKQICKEITDGIIKQLSANQRGFKFICTCTIMEIAHASMFFSSSCDWQKESDGSITVRVDAEQFHVLVRLFALRKPKGPGYVVKEDNKRRK